jgi:hypothetical protein
VGRFQVFVHCKPAPNPCPLSSIPVNDNQVDVQAVVNYEKLLKSIAKTFSRIADILPRADLHLRLYSTTYMLSDVAQIYASILLFVRRATEWYAKNRIQRSLSAVIRPFEISFKDIVDNIMACSRRVDERAGAAMKAELRDLHIEIMQMRDSTNGKWRLQSSMNPRFDFDTDFLSLSLLTILK